MAADSEIGDVGREERQRRVQHGDIDELAAARVRALVERARHGEGRGHAGDGVAHGKARPRRPHLRVAGDRHQAAHRLDLAVVGGGRALRAVLAEARYRAIDELGVDGCQRCMADAELVHHAGAEVLHHHVGLGGKAMHDLDRLRLGEIEGETALVGVDAHESGRQVARRPVLVGRAAAHVVAAGRSILTTSAPSSAS
jgi:hypothetical protein